MWDLLGLHPLGRSLIVVGGVGILLTCMICITLLLPCTYVAQSTLVITQATASLVSNRYSVIGQQYCYVDTCTAT